LRFPGQWFQSETGLHQNWMRDYDPTTGRYIQADPLGITPGPSLYGYAHQSPMVYADPNGEHPLKWVWSVIRNLGGGARVDQGPSASPMPPLPMSPAPGGTLPQSVPDSGSQTCERCPPCQPYRVGTRGYQVETGNMSRGDGSQHYHLFEVQQIPGTCECIWRERTKGLTGQHHVNGWNSLSVLGATVNLTGRGRPPPYP